MGREYMYTQEGLIVRIASSGGEAPELRSKALQDYIGGMIAERLEALVEEVHSIDESLKWLGNSRFKPLADSMTRIAGIMEARIGYMGEQP